MHGAALMETGAPVVLAEDYNVVPTEADIYSSRSWKRDALLQPESRCAMPDCWIRAGPTPCASAFRTTRRPGPSGGISVRPGSGTPSAHRRPVAQPAGSERLVDAGVDRDVPARVRASDHAPVWIELRD